MKHHPKPDTLTLPAALEKALGRAYPTALGLRIFKRRFGGTYPDAPWGSPDSPALLAVVAQEAALAAFR